MRLLRLRTMSPAAFLLSTSHSSLLLRNPHSDSLFSPVSNRLHFYARFPNILSSTACRTASLRSFASLATSDKIKVRNPIVEMDGNLYLSIFHIHSFLLLTFIYGEFLVYWLTKWRLLFPGDEMARVIWNMIKDKVWFYFLFLWIIPCLWPKGLHFRCVFDLGRLGMPLSSLYSRIWIWISSILIWESSTAMTQMTRLPLKVRKPPSSKHFFDGQLVLFYFILFYWKESSFIISPYIVWEDTNGDGTLIVGASDCSCGNYLERNQIRIIFNFCNFYEICLCIYSLSIESFKDKLFFFNVGSCPFPIMPHICSFNLYLYSAYVIRFKCFFFDPCVQI